MDDTELPRALMLLHEHGLHEAQKMLARAWRDEMVGKRKRRGVASVPVKLQGKYPARLPATVLMGATPVSPPACRKSRPVSSLLPQSADPAGANKARARDKPGVSRAP